MDLVVSENSRMAKKREVNEKEVEEFCEKWNNLKQMRSSENECKFKIIFGREVSSMGNSASTRKSKEGMMMEIMELVVEKGFESLNHRRDETEVEFVECDDCGALYRRGIS